MKNQAHHSDRHHVSDTGHSLRPPCPARGTPDYAGIWPDLPELHGADTGLDLKVFLTHSSNLEGDQNEHYH
jgi:hypothetical protein